MTTALERAARAASQADLDWEPANGLAWNEYIARAVLMAVREPDDAIEEAGAPFTDNILPGSAFTAMIDAILNEKAE